jgi:ABC-type sugar transport system substrate-binding protein
MGGRLAASPPLAPALALALALALLAAVAPACARLAARESERVGTRLESFELTWRARLREFLVRMRRRDTRPFLRRLE